MDISYQISPILNGNLDQNVDPMNELLDLTSTNHAPNLSTTYHSHQVPQSNFPLHNQNNSTPSSDNLQSEIDADDSSDLFNLDESMNTGERSESVHGQLPGA